MVLVLVVGDLHVPQRAASIPKVFTQMFTPGRIQLVLITGNVGCREMYDYFRSIVPDVYCAKGEFDSCWWPNVNSKHASDTDKLLQDTHVINVESLRIGLIHGHQAIPCGDRDMLAMLQRKLDVDVLVSGATHNNKVFEFGGHLFVNPGSITGAFTTRRLDVVPTFVLLDIQDKKVTSFSYAYAPGEGVGGEDFKIKRKTWIKDEEEEGEETQKPPASAVPPPPPPE
ncbi:vacuolar sorting protein, putative [Trypanosoma brucei gambiense DAL972]|uniref:Vacuolar protein sorting-associated protein 29 n=2 Tax=Trypanosoma brucei TaxID=5691 RepID=Q382A8_TRYB2|nr:vacuolar sorting protein, putative [Trypanosoma brucei gambiense DAL972]XP_829485.1 vacuolar sorting protein, putative [Trypanosoma brucei brucei TREU927]EAN80373.1 vacuolar sorting protein, putative [Trypanosoma brucei brucei TREU927]CBH18481.1 vacuolar sorting protein, putative [Trypanosoma brucei gambiense DAL972]|eukprot:XP_011780745.1 vacuolar sorting protein, putative [Trypanosoma brucei gambiense DAL972]